MKYDSGVSIGNYSELTKRYLGRGTSVKKRTSCFRV